MFTTYRRHISTLIISLLMLALVLMDAGTDSSQVYTIVRTVFGGIYMIFLPWYWLTRVFFDETEIDMLERGALSFALSISVVPLIVFYLNLAGVPITALMVWGVVLGVIVLSRWVMLFQQRRAVVSS